MSVGNTSTLVIYSLQSIQSTLTRLTHEELMKFKMWFYQYETSVTVKQMMHGDLLDFVDKIIEVLGRKKLLVVEI